jgi:AcrR family transcriptional regulator
MAPVTGVPPEPRSRRRGSALENAILDAAWDELTCVGYAEVTMSGVAARAGTSKAVLYRRWQNRTELLAAAVDRRVVRLDASPPDTGSLRGDLIAVLSAVTRRALAARSVPDPGGDLAAYLRRQAIADGLAQLSGVLRRAGQRGEIDVDSLSPRVARLPIDLLHAELSLHGAPVSPGALAEIVDDIVLPLARRHAHASRPD